MKRRPRIYYSASQRALIWDRWRKGETLHQIAGLFDRYHSSIQRIVSESGGIRPTERHRSKTALTLIEREEISRGVVAGKSIRVIAAALGWPTSWHDGLNPPPIAPNDWRRLDDRYRGGPAGRLCEPMAEKGR